MVSTILVASVRLPNLDVKLIFDLCYLLGAAPGTDVGPVISPQSKQRILELVQSGIDEGARIILDGRNISVTPGYEKGNFVGPTILTDVKVLENAESKTRKKKFEFS